MIREQVGIKCTLKDFGSSLLCQNTDKRFCLMGTVLVYSYWSMPTLIVLVLRGKIVLVRGLGLLALAWQLTNYTLQVHTNAHTPTYNYILCNHIHNQVM